MNQFFEAAMVICFGASWPLSIYKSYTSRSAKGKSLLFLLLILLGYVCGIGAKLLSGKVTYVLAFYILNFFMVATDIFLYFRNKRLEESKVKTEDTITSAPL